MPARRTHMYCARNLGTSSEIVPVEVERATEHSVYIKGRRAARSSSYESFFDTWDEAHAHLVHVQEQKVAAARRSLAQAEHTLTVVRAIEPSGEGESPEQDGTDRSRRGPAAGP